jgi:hypothetical protein
LGATINNVQNEGARLSLTGDFSARIEIDISSNLAGWSPLVTFSNSYGVSQYTDLSATNVPRRFYRAFLLP